MVITYGNPQITPFVLSNGQTAYTNPSLLPNYGVQRSALGRVANDVQVASCVSASRKIDGYISDRYLLPLLVFDYDLVEYASKIAIYDAMTNIGFNPETGEDSNIKTNYICAIEYMGRVQRQSANLSVGFNSPNPPNFNMPTVYTHRPRGWEGRGGPFRGGRGGFF